ncbi:hypothetical protein CEXT_659511 [Caerostris extrusa]|uniref:Uncharacterized protein n=1 Tax=Caerostris extrusa TaxID=172846 RepID=A0AAV4PKE5_CAEEX|nr:hypothetical protein CEXT_659511 [Caerostris extrusa]
MTLEREYVNNNNTTNQITNRNESRGCNTSITSTKECRNYVSSLTGFTNIIKTQAVYQQVFVDIDINAKNVARDAKENLLREEEGSLDYEEPEPSYSEINDPESDDNVNQNSLTSNNVWYEHKLYDTSKERISRQDEKYVETGNHTSQWTGRRELSGCNASISSRRVWRGWRQLSVTRSEQRVNDLSAITGHHCFMDFIFPFYSDISDEEQSNADTQIAEEDIQVNFSDISDEENAADRLNDVDQNNQCNSAQHATNNQKSCGRWYYHYSLNPNNVYHDYNNENCSAWYGHTSYYKTNEDNGRQEASDKINAVNLSRDAEDDVSIKENI